MPSMSVASDTGPTSSSHGPRAAEYGRPDLIKGLPTTDRIEASGPGLSLHRLPDDGAGEHDGTDHDEPEAKHQAEADEHSAEADRGRPHRGRREVSDFAYGVGRPTVLAVLGPRRP